MRFACVVVLFLVLFSGCGDDSVIGTDAGGTDSGSPPAPDSGGPPVSPYVVEWTRGDPGVATVEQLAFAPDGTLFVVDAAAGVLAAVDLGPADASERTGNQFVDLPGFGRQLGAALGGTDGLSVSDLDVHPVTHQVFMAVSNATQSALVRVDGAGEVLIVDLSDVPHARVALTADAAGSFAADLDVGRSHLFASIGARTFTSGRVLSVPFPIGAGAASTAATTRTYHRSHGQWEQSDTVAPVERLVVVEDVEPAFVAASYTCAPVVRLPLGDLARGGQVLGQTPFDLGAGRQIIDIVLYPDADAVLMVYADGIAGTINLVRAERALLSQSDAIDEAAPVVLDRAGGAIDPRVTTYPEYAGILRVAPRGDDPRFVAMYRTGRLATHDLP